MRDLSNLCSILSVYYRVIATAARSPIHGKSHRCGVDRWVGGKQGINLGLHVIAWRNDVQEILDDAETEIGFLLIDRNRYPRLGHTSLRQNPQGKCTVPYAGMMTAIVSGYGDNRHP